MIPSHTRFRLGNRASKDVREYSCGVGQVEGVGFSGIGIALSNIQDEFLNLLPGTCLIKLVHHWEASDVW